MIEIFFIKYVTNDAARSILEFQTLRWGCPLYFNDPFDSQIF